jgi:3-deoxy-D-manno-octulosonate 8-phosphate phosphatase (KDO 8-P phosphatase)
MSTLETLYTGIGGTFITPPEILSAKMEHIKAFVFDWDGVFNNGQKMSASGSSFSEVDSMGTNLLRFSHFLRHGQLPLTAILSGEKNETAFYFSERECLHYSFFKVPHKLEALNFLWEKEKIRPEQIAFFFDDVLDLPLAEVCGLRIMINQGVNPQFLHYCKKNNLVDYLTSVPGGSFAVRESTELLIGLNDNYEEVITSRKNNTSAYQNYITARRLIHPGFYTLGKNGIEEESNLRSL